MRPSSMYKIVLMFFLHKFIYIRFSCLWNVPKQSGGCKRLGESKKNIKEKRRETLCGKRKDGVKGLRVEKCMIK